jgi:hypothetical protein
MTWLIFLRFYGFGYISQTNESILPAYIKLKNLFEYDYSGRVICKKPLII